MNALNCIGFAPRDDGLLCDNCGAGITQHPSPHDVPKLEHAADQVIALCSALGLTIDEVASMTHSIAVNHFVASGVTEERAAIATQLAHRWRVSQGHNDRVLVKRPAKIGGT